MTQPPAAPDPVQAAMQTALDRIAAAVTAAEAIRDDLCSVRDDLRAALTRIEAERGAAEQ